MKDGAMLFFTATGATHLILPANARRTGLIFSAATGANVLVGTTDAVSGARGLIIAGGGPPLKLCKCEVGDYVQRAWFMADEGAGGDLTVVELVD